MKLSYPSYFIISVIVLLTVIRQNLILNLYNQDDFLEIISSVVINLSPFLHISADGEYSNWFNRSQSQVKQFQDFILRASKYPTLSIFNENSSDAVKKIILVEVSTRLLSKCIFLLRQHDKMTCFPNISYMCGLYTRLP